MAGTIGDTTNMAVMRGRATAYAIEWLLAGDPAIRWQVCRDLTHASPDGRWKLEHRYPGAVFFELERLGQPSRWNILRALRVLRWWEDEHLPGIAK